ncbi:MAG: hypothetical protein ABIS50_18930 [Luteolibacter sp.]|uniref:hypothetical protein n=1 Tax=Luteolibacter sp. TaxID=1962973 RepID=UPI00326343B7
MKTTGKAARAPRSQGFALIATLLLMILLVVVAVGLLTLSSVSLRSTSGTQKTAEARANARLALMLAIGELQDSVGPDQRVTASAEITGATRNSKWTGVWSTTTKGDNPKPMVSGYKDGKYLADLRNTESSLTNGAWKEQLLLSWLVSGEPASPDEVDPEDSKNIKLVGNGALGSDTAVSDSGIVAAPYVKVGQGKKAGGYAYWVGDESQKARIDVASPYDNKQPNATKPTDGGVYRLAGAAGPDFTDVKAGTTTPYTDLHKQTGQERAKLISLKTLTVETGSKDAPTKNFHDISTHSKGLLTDVVMGGLQKDMTAALEATTDIPAFASVRGSGMTADQKILTPVNYSKTGPTFAQLRNWYRLKDKVTGGMLDTRMDTPQYVTTRTGSTNGSNFYNLTSPLPDITSSNQSIQPVIADFRLAFDFSLDTTVAPPRTGRSVRAHLYPRVTLWNPYNVTLKGQRYFVGSPLPVVDNLAVGPGTTPPKVEGFSDGSIFPGMTGNKIIYFTLAPVDLAPGEAVVFSPDISASTGAKIGGNAVKFTPTNMAANVLSANIPGGTNNFYFDSNVQVAASVTAAALAAKPDYTFTGGVNQAYGSPPTMFLKRVKTTAATVSLSTLNSTSAETLQLIHISQSGTTKGQWWYLFGNAMNAVNGGEGFQNYLGNPNRFPPRLWALETRLRWLDESDEQASVNKHSGSTAGEFYYNSPVMGNFNVRSSMVFRDPFSYYNGWTKYAPGGYMLPWSMPRLNDPRMDAPYREGKSHGSPLSAPSVFSAAPAFAMFDLPRQGSPVFSLASFQHAQLGIHSWQPSYVIGNSIAEPRSARDGTVNLKYYNAKKDAWGPNLSRPNERPAVWDDLIQNQGDQTLVYDMSYQVNQALWDRYFLSTMPYNSSSASWNPKQPLPNSRLEPFNMQDAIAQKAVLTGKSSFDSAAYFLGNNGAFNVNSTSVEAWRALFSTLNNISRPTVDGGTIEGAFSRLLFPMSAEEPTATTSNGTWNGARKLSQAEIGTLAENMVRVVKARGPFLGMADFVNRRLATATTNNMSDPSMCGPLQAAIEMSGINSSLQKTQDLTSSNSGGANTSGEGDIEPDWKAFYPYKNFGAPGYLTQADVLQTVGQNLTSRGDTFVVRAYGDVRDSNGNITARAWCEAVIQRVPDYINTKPIDGASDSDGNNPAEPALVGAGAGQDFSATVNSALLPINRKFGRRFVVENFRWLSPSEI